MRSPVRAKLSSFAVAGGRVCATLLAFALAGCVITPGQNSPAGAREPESTAIRAARLAQNEALAVGDLDGIAAFWTDDVVVRPSLGSLIVGRNAYRQSFASDPPGTVFVRQPARIEVSEHWDVAFESGDWSWHLGGVSSPAIVTGRYSAQWIKQNGRWLIRAEVFVALTCEASGCERPVAR